MSRKTLSVLILNIFCVFLIYQFLPHDHQPPGDHISISHGDHHHHHAEHHHHDSKESTGGLLGFLMENHGHSYHADYSPQLTLNTHLQIKIKDLPSDDFQVSIELNVNAAAIAAPRVETVTRHLTNVFTPAHSQRGPPLTSLLLNSPNNLSV